MASPSSLGKRKAGSEEASPQHGSTLFVSNLPYSATSTDLQTLFSDIAPVRTAFVVTEQGTGFSKGVGYISFAIKEDAQTAYDQIQNEGLSLNGRPVRVQWADAKPKDKMDNSDQKEQKKRPEPHRAANKDPLATRTVVIGGLPSGLDEKVLWKKIRKSAGAEKVDWPIGADQTTAHVLFNTPAQASDAVAKLHAHVYKGALLSASLKKRLEHLAVHSSATQTPIKSKTATAPSNSSRLIIRNLPFDIMEQDIRSVFLPFGPIYSISIPKDEDDKGKGFAFVHFYSAKDAKAALEGANGKSVHKGMASNLVEDKQKKKKEIRLASKGDEKEEKKSKERVIAVDWALSKDRWEVEKAKAGGDEGDVNMASPSGDEEESSDDDDEDSESHLGLHSGSSDEDDNSEEEDDDEEQEPTKPELPPPETGTTIFIRNVPYSATEDDLRALFRSFGPLRYARITMDHETGRSRGTGFACFWNKEHADKVIEESEKVKQETFGATSTSEQAEKEKEKKKNPFAMHSILTPDPSSSLAQTLVLNGRTLDVVRAVTRGEATKLREDGERKREKADKRNLYLLREGVIFPNSPAADTLSAPELAKRQASYNARKNLLKTNPSLFVSKKRLSVRQIPIFATERTLRKLASHAVKQFELEVRDARRNGLSHDELHPIDEEDEDGTQESGPPSSKFRKGGAAAGGTKQTKIVRAQDRIDSITGKGRSKGYGFIEMITHADALRVLRWCNNNPEVGQLLKGWWKDEVAGLVKSEKARIKAQAKKEKKQENENEDEGVGDGERLKRYEEELARLDAGSGKKAGGGPNLIVEFSIENVQVVRRRAERAGGRGKKRMDEAAKDHEEEEQNQRPSPAKRRKVDTTKKRESDSAKGAEEHPQKAGNKIGSIIGRKRKQRKTGKH